MIYEKNGLMYIKEKKSENIIDRFYSEMNNMKIEVVGNVVKIIVFKWDDTINIDYIGSVDIVVNNENVSRETFENGLIEIDFSTSEIGVYDIVVKSEKLNDCVVTYEKK